VPMLDCISRDRCWGGIGMTTENGRSDDALHRTYRTEIYVGYFQSPKCPKVSTFNAKAHIRLQGLPCRPPPCSILIIRRKRVPIVAKPMYRPCIFLATWNGFDIRALWGGRLGGRGSVGGLASGWVVRRKEAGFLMT